MKLKAPKRIWVPVHLCTKKWVQRDEGDTEYIRADAVKLPKELVAWVEDAIHILHEDGHKSCSRAVRRLLKRAGGR